MAKKAMAAAVTSETATATMTMNSMPQSRTRQKPFLTISEALAREGLTTFLQGLSVIDDGYEVTHITKAPGALDLKIERIANEDH